MIVWSTPGSIDHATRSGNTYTQGAPITPARTGFGPNVAVSDDGNLIAFETSTGVIALVDRRTPTSFEPISVDDGGKTVTGAGDPSISGDGTLVTYTLAPVFSGGALSVVLRDRPNGVNRAIAAPATSAEISRDGRYVAVLLRIGEIGETYVVRSTSAQPFATVAIDLVSYRDGDPAAGTGGSTSNPAISEHGRWVTFDSYAASLLVPGQGFDGSGTQVYVRQRRPAVTVDSIDFGTVGGATNRQATVRSVGLAGFVVTSIAATGDFSVVGHDCPAVLHPDATCLVTVRFKATAAGSVNGVLTVQDDSYPGVPLSGTGKLFGSFNPGVPTVPTTTPTPTTLPRPPGTAGLSIAPDPVVFDGVVVGSAAPQRSATVTNTGDVSVTVSSVSLSGGAAPDFSVANDACTGVSLASGTSCQLELGFSPSQAGDRSAMITASGSGSTSASAGLSGAGRFDAVLMVTPEVAAGGQVVTVVGTGFPPSANVSLILGDDAAVIVATDAAGAFMHPWLILSGIPQGELLADDVAVDGSYDAEPAPLQVVGTPMRPQATATLSRLGRSHVSACRTRRLDARNPVSQVPNGSPRRTRTRKRRRR